MLDVADAVGHISRPRHARYGDAFAAQRESVAARVERVLDHQPYIRIGVAFKACADLLGGKARGILAVDRDDPVADAYPRAVGRRALVWLCEYHVVALLPYERTHTAVLSRGHDLERGHLLLGQILRIGVERRGHACRRALQQQIGVDLVDILRRQLAQHVDEHFCVAPQCEIFALRPLRPCRRVQCRRRGKGQNDSPQPVCECSICHPSLRTCC